VQVLENVRVRMCVTFENVCDISPKEITFSSMSKVLSAKNFFN
jgi:hypothetical protein